MRNVDKSQIVKPYDFSDTLNSPILTFVIISLITWNSIDWCIYIVNTYSTLSCMTIIISNIFIGWCTVDLVSGLIHGIVDRLPVNSGNQTIIGGHHRYPMNYELLTHHQLIGISYFFILPFLIIHLILNYTYDYSRSAYSGWFIIMMLLGLLCGHCHLYCHRRKINSSAVPFIFQVGQDMGFFMHPESHQKHHTNPNVCTGFFSQKMDWLTNWILHPCRFRSIPPLTKEDKQCIVENYRWYRQTYMSE
jgi:hypothetical protein